MQSTPATIVQTTMSKEKRYKERGREREKDGEKEKNNLLALDQGRGGV